MNHRRNGDPLGKEMENIKRKKAELRKRILAERDSLLLEQRRVWDKQIFNYLIRYDEEKPCEIYLCYVNYKSEVETKEFIRWCLQKGKTVFVPKVLTSEDMVIEESGSFQKKRKAVEMEFYRIFRFEDLKAGYWGILEPEDLAENRFSLQDFLLKERVREDLLIRMLMPGAVFDKERNRIGYGGGFYDKWLAKWENEKCGRAGKLEKIGVAYQMQIMEEIPAEPFDKKADLVVTEEGMSERPL